MDNCFNACGSANDITNTDLDRFTDRIENVLNDERGRKLFRNFMCTSKMKAGQRALTVWEHTERLLNYREDAESGTRTHQNYLDDVKDLLKKAERVEAGFVTMERLTTAVEADKKEGIVEGLQSLKVEATRALGREYTALRNHLLKYR